MKRLIFLFVVLSIFMVACSSNPKPDTLAPVMVTPINSTAILDESISASETPTQSIRDKKPQQTQAAESSATEAALATHRYEIGVTKSFQLSQTPKPSWTATPTKTKTPTITATTDFSQYANTWVLFENSEYGISFDYPAIYDVHPYTLIQCAPRVSNFKDDRNQILVGQAMYLDFWEASGQSLKDAVESFVERNEGYEFVITSQTDTYIGGEKATILEYRFGNMNRYGSAAFFKHDNIIYSLVFNATVFCEILAEDTASGMSELSSFFRIIETFRFVE